MNSLLCTLCGLLLLCAIGGEALSAESLILAKNGESDYKIVVSAKASPSERYASEELQRFLKEMTGAELPIVTDDEKLASQEIIVGENAHAKKVGVHPDMKKLGVEGYLLKTSGHRLVIAGSPTRGTLYGVYGLLEDHFGCHWFAPGVNQIPKVETLAVESLNETKVPALEYREPFVYEAFDGDWAARNRMNSANARLDEKHGGKIIYNGFVHTFYGLVPPEKYFKTHPEYFSEIDGKRVSENAQLCATNDDVARIATEEIEKRMREHPEATVFSVSQNDCGGYCTCPKCKALAEKEGSQIAPVLYLANRVAEAVEKEFPDKVIDTLAYQWGRKPPKTMRPRKNVIVRLCSIECCFSHPLETCDSKENQSFRQDLEGWSKMSDRLWVWDYTTSFSNYYIPFPNLSVMSENIKYFQKNHVTGIFEEDNYQSPNGDMSELGAYIMAKSLWDPDYPRGKAMSDFLEGVYGPAAKPIRQYIDLLHDKVTNDHIHMHIWEGPGAAYLSDDILSQADRLWGQAEEAAASDPAILDRVKAARMAVDYTILERQTKKAEDAKTTVGESDFAARADRFFSYAAKYGVTQLNEGGYPVAEFKSRLEKVTAK